MNNQFVWVDIPVTDLDRAIKFYSAVLGCTITKGHGPGLIFGLLPHEDTNVGGCLVLSAADSAPSLTGPLVYLNAEGRLADAVNAVNAAGGKVLQDIHPIGPWGYRAIFRDSEGNRVALHSMTEASI
ncbi:MAG: hypothetical protein K0R08_1383 [Solimicrobium sp.]|jgi:predicted enzyme related to lactoylglutathione lyase|nr:hypothetical protein [Solimicrobium sp.]